MELTASNCLNGYYSRDCKTVILLKLITNANKEEIGTQ